MLARHPTPPLRCRAFLAALTGAVCLCVAGGVGAEPIVSLPPRPGTIALPPAPVRDHAPGRILLQLVESSCTPDASLTCATSALALLEDAGLHTARVLHRPAPGRVATPLDRTWVAEVDPATDVRALAAALADLPDVALASPDWIGTGASALPAPNDPWFGEQWALEQDGDHDIDVLAAWEVTQGKPRVVIAVLDSGLDPSHLDFPAERVVAGHDFVNDDSDPLDDLGHGTHVAGIAAAGADDDVGVAGVCPGCSVMAVKVLNHENIGVYSWWIEGITWAVDHGASVINLSAGGIKNDEMLRQAVQYAADHEVALVAAMMNFDNDVPYYPAAWPESIAVGATDENDLRAAPFNFGGGSNHGAHIDLVAPGSRIQGSLFNSGTGAAELSGTSQSVPLVAGTIGLLLTAEEHLTIEDLRVALTATAVDQVGRPDEDLPGFDRFHGHGRLNAALAVRTRSMRADLDGDGVRPPMDCDDFRDQVYPAADEVPRNGLDDDCDPSTRDDLPFDSDVGPGADMNATETVTGGGCCTVVSTTSDASRGSAVLLALGVLVMVRRRRRRHRDGDAP